ncbi:hypothetical protein DFJ58DRAFT_914749 [Suillus subalutaceus]|uniref:uncharacterized protein n=1 Tax=Suillus subalutaceus TaxID=48586 RepID=UPI001B869CBA|nr:uncharacterized protein DFJ58DRAFT_914749 [Suillus subalutaceus]KAG1850241.1 hypothetical protein DFJ58DRAFT_914749 [Suillus subalutaceus]
MWDLGDELLQQAPANDLKDVSTPCTGNAMSLSSKGHYIDKAWGKDRYRELMRVARQWRQLKTMKWHGFGHCSDSPNAGDLALFCPACPQPGINVSFSGDESLDEWKYTRSFVMDRNFKAEHLHPMKPFDEVWLSDGLGFMVGKDRYKTHLAEAANTLEKSSCNNHRAVNQANAARHKLESTGIGGVACIFRKAKGKPTQPFDIHEQMNMDYALCEAARHNMEGITRAVTFYDINCQYNKHFRVRVDRSRFLEMIPELTIIPGIGLWHIHGHQDSCYVRYASNFIEGIGRIDGEIMETLWSRLNLISPAARGMSSPHRKECLDYQMNDSNFCKMIRMKRTLCRKYNEKAFDILNEAAPGDSKTEWLASERIAQSSRINNPAAMDVYEINIKKAPSKKEIELRLLEEGNARNAAPARRSVATWISMGLAIEEAQIALLIEVRRIGRRTTETQKLDIARQRDRLQGQIDGFTRSAITHLGEGFDADDDPEDLYLDILDDLDDDLADFTETSDTWANSPELTVIPLPSNLGASQIPGPENSSLVPGDVGAAGSVPPCQYIHEDEEANDATGARARPALPSAIQMPKVSKTSPSLGSGQSKSTLGVPITRGMRNLTESSEVYRVHWLRAKALRDRWKEEMMLVQLEMDWTCNFFLWKATQWGDRMRESLVKHLPGHACYSGRQSQMYSLLAQDAQAAFQDLKTGLPAMGSDPSHSLRQILQLQCQWLHLRIRASISQYQMEAAHTQEPSATRITHFKAGLQWEIATFVTPILQYSAARNIILVVPSLVAHILQLIPELTWNMVPDHIFSSHLCQFQDVADLGDPSRIVSTYGTPWWTGSTAIPNELWPWDQVFANCVCHYQHWLSGFEDEHLVVPEQVDESSLAMLKALRWMRERLLTVIEDQQAGIREKMAEIQMYTAVLTKLNPRGPE